MVRFWAVFLAVFLGLSAASAQDGGALRFGVVPQGPPAEILAAWQPIAAALERDLGRPVEAVTTPDIPTFEACVHMGLYDIVYLNPYHYVVFSQTTGYRAVAHRADARLKGLIIVNQDSAVTSLAQLEGERIAFPSQAAFAASILVRAELRAAGIDYTPVYTRSHESGYLAVARDLLVAAGGVNRTFGIFTANNPDYGILRVIHQPDGYTPHPIAVAPRLNEQTVAQITQTLSGLHYTDPEALTLLAIGRFQSPQEGAYDDVRALAIPPEETGINLQGNPACRSG